MVKPCGCKCIHIFKKYYSWRKLINIIAITIFALDLPFCVNPDLFRWRGDTDSKCKCECLNTIMLTSWQERGYSMVQGQHPEPLSGWIMKTASNIKKYTKICGTVVPYWRHKQASNKMFRGQTPLVCLHTMKQWPLSLLLVTGPVLIWSE